MEEKDNMHNNYTPLKLWTMQKVFVLNGNTPAPHLTPETKASYQSDL